MRAPSVAALAAMTRPRPMTVKTRLSVLHMTGGSSCASPATRCMSVYTEISKLDSCRRTPSVILRSMMPRTRPVNGFLTPDRLLGPRRELLGAFCRRRGLLVPVRQSLSAAPAITVNAKASSRSRYGSNPPSLLIVAPWNSSRIEPSKPSLNASLRDSPIRWAFHVRGKVTETPCITASNVCRFYHTRKVIREIQVRALPARLLLSHADRCRDHLATRQRLPPVAAGPP